MDLTLPPEARDFASAARASLQRFGARIPDRAYGSDKAVQAQVETALTQLGLFDLDPLGSPVEGLAAALAAVECGRVAAPLPVAALITARAAGRTGTMHAIECVPSRGELLIDHVRQTPIAMIDIQGTVHTGASRSDGRASRMLAPNAGWVDPVEEAGGDPRWWALHECMSAFVTLGTLEAANEHTRAHLLARQQFGKPLAQFQALQHRLADSIRYVYGLRELSLYTLSRLLRESGDPVADALALRLYHLEAIGEVLRHAHQSHGAIGFCFEHVLPTLSLSVQYRRYSPTTDAQTASLLAGRLDAVEMIFGNSPSTSR